MSDSETSTDGYDIFTADSLSDATSETTAPSTFERSQAVTKPKETLLAYKSLSSRRVDLISDFAGNELFLIEGDSLLLQCFSDSHLDFQNGYQALHAIYLVEEFLGKLISRKCNFHIAFFEEHRGLCVPEGVTSDNASKYGLVRTAIFQHLARNLAKLHPAIKLHKFASPNSQDFKDYLAKDGMYFVMCHDGATPIHLSNRAAAPKTSMKSRQKQLLRSVIISFVKLGYNVALINELEWRDTKALTMVLEGPRRGKLPNFPMASPAEALEKSNDSWVETTISQLDAESDAQKLNIRERVAVLAITRMLSSGSIESSDFTDIKAFLLHIALLRHLPMSARHFSSVPPTQEGKRLLQAYATTGSTIMRSAAWATTSSQNTDPTIIDLVDGRLFNALLGAATEEFPAEVMSTFELLCRLVSEQLKSTTIDTSTKAIANGHAKLPAKTEATKESSLRVLPFENDVFDKHLESIHLEIEEVAEPESVASARIFREATHWHNAKRPIVVKGPEPPKSAKDAMWAAKRNQWFMAEMQKYAASLTNSIGKTLDPETVVVGAPKKHTAPVAEAKDTKPAAKDNAADAKKKGGAKAGKQGGKKAAMMESIAAANAKKGDATNDKLVQAWQTVCKAFTAEKDLANRYTLLKDYLTSMTKPKREILGAEVQLYMVSVLLERYIALCKSSKPDLGLAATIWNHSKTISDTGMTKTIASKIDLTVETLGLPKIKTAPKIDKERTLPFTFALPTPAKQSLAIDMTPKDFQLLYCGPYLDRSIDSAPDDRVDFEPDAWQRRVLDGIDANRSMVVVAPTSAGKTFISFYAMRKVLEADDDSVLVYVAPTKALVNQIAAEIQARYSKNFKYGGKSVWGIHTRDYRINNPTGCQVLVTVPHVLQIMLLAPSHANTWAKRVKSIIFDEVHSIGNAEDGVVWEQLLLLSPCPIIALSATVGNPEEFSGWLESTQAAIGNKLEMVQHTTRYSDLRKYYYRAPKNFAFNGLGSRADFAGLGLDGTPGLSFVHPVGTLVNKSRGIPDDLSLEPRDCLTLWQAMNKHQTQEYPVPADLHPSKALPTAIRKVDTLAWEQKLKVLLKQWMEAPDSPFDAVLAELASPLRTSQPEQLQLSKAGAEKAAKEIDRNDILQTTLPLLCSLNEQDALPAILFNYDRGLCEKICQKVVREMADCETDYKERSPKWKATLKAYEEWKTNKERIEANRRKVRQSRKASKQNEGDAADEDKLSKLDQAKDATSGDSSIFDRFDPNAPVDGFHFADHKKVQLSELQLYIRQLGRRNIQQWLVDGILRGIGVHHAGMNRKYRQVVEILFRKGFLRVVIATGTLALGINMPCKTVVFSGDSVFLTALNFRQGAGRAGRRGFDLLGNVVFQNITESKVCRLLSSRLPDLNGHFPITTTLVLRLMTLLHESKRSAYAVKAVNTILSQPRMYMGGPSFKDQTLHHLRFSIEYLRRQHLLDSKGATLNFAGLVSHLYFTENASFAFHALLKEGYFHRLCANIDSREQYTIETLMLVMSHLFGRVYCKQSDEEYKQKVVKPSSSIVFMPSLPGDALEVLQQHGDETLQVFTTYVRTFVDQHVQHADDTLPVTGLKAGSQTPANDVTSALGSTVLPAPHIRSSFAALSGHTDTFTSIPDLCQTVRSGVFLEESVIPHIGIYPQELATPLNAYLLDFFKHGDLKTLERANGVRRGDVWFLLNDFSLVLATIVASLMGFMKLRAANDLDMLDITGSGEAIEEAVENAGASAEEEDEGKAVMTTEALPAEKKGPAAVVVGQSKAKKAESWEDVADEEEGKAKVEARRVKLEEEVKKADLGDAAWLGDEGEKGLLKVLKAFQKLHAEFNVKFRAIWA